MRSPGAPITAGAISIPFCTVAGLVDCAEARGIWTYWEGDRPAINDVVQIHDEPFLVTVVYTLNCSNYVNVVPLWEWPERQRDFFDISRVTQPADRAAFQHGQADRIRGVRANQVMIDDVQEIDPAVLARVRGDFARAGTDVRFEDMEITDVQEFVDDDGVHRTSIAMRARNPVPGEPFTLAFNLQPSPGEPNRNGDIFEAGAYEMQSTEFDDNQTVQVDESDQHPDNH